MPHHRWPILMNLLKAWTGRWTSSLACRKDKSWWETTGSWNRKENIEGSWNYPVCCCCCCCCCCQVIHPKNMPNTTPRVSSLDHVRLGSVPFLSHFWLRTGQAWSWNTNVTQSKRIKGPSKEFAVWRIVTHGTREFAYLSSVYMCIYIYTYISRCSPIPGHTSKHLKKVFKAIGEKNSLKLAARLPLKIGRNPKGNFIDSNHPFSGATRWAQKPDITWVK